MFGRFFQVRERERGGERKREREREREGERERERLCGETMEIDRLTDRQIDR